MTKNNKSSIAQPLWRRHFYSVLALLYVIQAGLIFFLANTQSVSVTATYLAKDTLASNAAGSMVLAPASQHVFDANLAGVIVAILLLSAVTHVVLAYVLRRSSKTEDTQIGRERRLRWAGLGASMVVATYLVCLVLGVRDLTALVPIATLSILVAVAGYLLETRQQLSRRVIFSLAGLAALVPWLLLGLVVVLTAQYGELTAAVQWVYVVSAVLALLLYAGVYGLYSGRRPLKLEVAVFVSLVVLLFQSALAWQVFAGFLR